MNQESEAAAALKKMARQLPLATGREVVLDERSYLFFGGTAYLGLNQHPDFLNRFLEGLELYGLNNGTSRTNNVQLDIYNKAESYATRHFQFESSLILSSGFLAAQLVARYFASQNGGANKVKLIYGPCHHPALWTAGRPEVQSDFQEWTTQTIEEINNSPDTFFVILSNTVDNVLPRCFDFSGFARVHADKQIHFVLDDSHGLGILDPGQCPVARTIPDQAGFSTTIVASMAKGMGIDAGLILTNRETAENLRKTGIFVGASPPAPAFLYAWLQASDLYLEQHKKLQRNISQFEAALKSSWLRIPRFPVFTRPGVALYEQLIQKGILISSFAYPNPEDPAVDRIVISAAHSREDIQTLINVLDELGLL